MRPSDANTMQSLPQDLCVLLNATDRRRRRLDGLQGMAKAALVLLIGGLGLVIADRLGFIGDGFRTMLSVVLWLLVLVLFGVKALWPWLHRESSVLTARRIESAADADLHERFSAAVALSASPGSEHWMVRRTVALAANEVAGVRPEAAVPSDRLRRHLRLLIIAALPLLLSLAWADGRAWWGRALLPWTDILRPARHRIVLLVDEHLRVVRGRHVVIAAVVDPDPKSADAHLRWADGRHQRLPLDRGEERPDGRRFDRHIDGIMQDVELHVVAADGRSRRVRIEVIDPPRITSARLKVSPPEYTRLGARTQNAGPLNLLVGTTLSLVVETSGPGIETVLLAMDSQQPQLPLQPSGEGRWVLDEWQPELVEDRRWHLAMVDVAGDEHVLAGPWSLQMRRDETPQARLMVVGGETYFSPNEIVALDLQAEDDIALESLNLVIEDRRRGGWIRRPKPLPLDPPYRGLWQRRHFIDLAAMAAEPDGTMILELVAVDIGGQEGRSQSLVLNIADLDAVADYRRARRLRAVQKDVEDIRRRLAGVRSQLRPLTVGVSESEAHDIFMAELRRSERGVRAAVADLQSLSDSWPRPVADEIGRAEAALRLRADAWLRIHGGELLGGVRQLRSAGEGAIDALLGSLNRSLEDIDAWLPGIVLCAAATESGDLARQSGHDQRRAVAAAGILETHLAWVGIPTDREADMAARMARVPPALARRAWEDLRQALSAGHDAVQVVAGWADEVADRDLQRLRSRIETAVVPVPPVALSSLDGSALEGQEQAVIAAAEHSAAVRRRFEALLRAWHIDRDQPVDLDDGRPRHLGERLRETVEQLRHERDAERRAELFVDAQATDHALQEALEERRRALRAAMADRDAPTDRRRDVRDASRRLRAAEAERRHLAQALEEAQRDSDQRPDLRREGRDLQRATQDLSSALAEVRKSDAMPHLERADRALARGDDPALEASLQAARDALRAAGRDEEAAVLTAADHDRRALSAALDELRQGDRDEPDDLRAAAQEMGRLAEEWSADDAIADLQRDILADAASILAEQAALQDDERAAHILDRARAALADEEQDRGTLLAQQSELLEDLRRGRVDLDADHVAGAPAQEPETAPDAAAELAALARAVRRMDDVEDQDQLLAAVQDALERHPGLRELLEEPVIDPLVGAEDEARRRKQLHENLEDRRRDVAAADEALRASDEAADRVRQRVVEELAAAAAEVEELHATINDDARPVLDEVAKRIDETRRQLDALPLVRPDRPHDDPLDDGDHHAPLEGQAVADALDRVREALAALAAEDDQDDMGLMAAVDGADAAAGDAAPAAAGDPPAAAAPGADEAATAAADPAAGDAAPAAAGDPPAAAAPGADEAATAAADPAAGDAAPAAAGDPPAAAAPGADEAATAAADAAAGDAAPAAAGAPPAAAAPAPGDTAPASAPPGAEPPSTAAAPADPVTQGEAALAAAHEALRQAVEAGDTRPADLAMAAAEYRALAEEIAQRAEQRGRAADIPDPAALDQAVQMREADQAAQDRHEALRRQELLAGLQEQAEHLIDEGATPLAAYWSGLDAVAQEDAGHRALADMGQHLATLAHDLAEAAQTAVAAGHHHESWADHLAALQDEAWQAVGDEPAPAAMASAVPIGPAQTAFEDLAAARHDLEQAQAHPHLESDRRQRREQAQERLRAAQQAVEEGAALAAEATAELTAALPPVPAVIDPTASAPTLAAQAAQAQQQAGDLRALADHLRQEGDSAGAESVAAGAHVAAAEAAAVRSQLQARDPALDQRLAAGAPPAAGAPAAAADPFAPASGQAAAPGPADAVGQAEAGQAEAGQADAAGQAEAAGQGEPGPGTGQAVPGPGAVQAAAAAAAAQASAAAAQSMQPGDGSGEGGNVGPAEPGEIVLGEAPDGVDQAAWARLPERERRAIRDQRGSTFAEEQRAAIRAYTRRLLAEE